MQILAPFVFLLGIHALPLPAQDPPLVVKTSSHEVAVGVLVRFGSFDFPPVLGPGEHHVMTLGEGGIKVVTSEGDAPLLQIEARPPALMAMYSDQMAQFRGVARSAGILALGQQGIQPGFAVQIIETIIGFPNQIEALSLTLTGDPQAPQAGYHAELTLAPGADTWFASLVDALAPASAGAPVLVNPNAMVQGTVAMALKTQEPLAPFMTLIEAMTRKSGEDKQSYMEMVQKSFDNMTGVGALTWDLESGMRIISGLKDPAAMKEILHDPGYMELVNLGLWGTPGVEIDHQIDLFEHRGVQVHKATIEMPAAMGIPNPLMPEGKVESHFAIAGNYSLDTSFGASDADIRQLIDLVLDRKIKPAPLPGDVLGTVSIQLAEYVKLMGAAMPPVDIPDIVRIDLAKADGQLVVRVDIK